MIVKNQSIRVPFIGLLSILSLTFILYLDRGRITEEAFTTIESIKAEDFGFSSLTRVFKIRRPEGATPEEARAHLGRGLLKELPRWMLTRFPRLVVSKIRGIPERPELKNLQIDIKFEDSQTILSNRLDALRDGILSSPTLVPCKVSFDGITSRASIRLKGDMMEHWRSPLRMSFRVNLKGDHYLDGMRKFSLQRPGARQYPYDQIFQDLVREAGGLSANTGYVKATVNGQKWGVMLVEEHMSKELLEKQSAKESLIMKFGNENDWVYERKAVEPYYPYHISHPKLFVSVFDDSRYFVERHNRALYSYIAENYRNDSYSEIVDRDSFATAAIISAIWNASHTLLNRNCRHYLNPYTLLLEPVTTDQVELTRITAGDTIFDKIDGFFSWAVFNLSGEGHFDQLRARAIEACESFERIALKHQSIFPADYPLDLSDFYHNLAFVSKIGWSDLVPRTPIGLDESYSGPPSVGQLLEMPSYVRIRHYDDGRLKIFNLLPVEVELLGLFYDEEALEVPIEAHVIPASRRELSFVEIDSGVLGVQDSMFSSKTSVSGVVKVDRSNFSHIGKTFNPLVGDSALPSFFYNNEQGWTIKGGNWKIEKGLVVDSDLFIDKGTVLRFAPDAYLIVKGSLSITGTETDPVILGPEANSWKGIYVINGKKESSLEFVTVKDTVALSDGLLNLTGGVTFYKSPVSIKNCQFLGTNAEDALNLVKSRFSINDVLFEGTVSDALDIDFSNGSITNVIFNDVGGDAADFSGSEVAIDHLRASNIRDKAVSAGEQSKLRIMSSHISSSGVGIAAKDGSQVKAEAINFQNITLYSLMTYVKKPIFGKASLEIENSFSGGMQRCIRQQGSSLVVDGKQYPESSVDVESLYQSEVMRKN